MAQRLATIQGARIYKPLGLLADASLESCLTNTQLGAQLRNKRAQFAAILVRNNNSRGLEHFFGV